MIEDFLFFYFIIYIRDNFKIMKNIKKILLHRKHITFSLLDAILIYYYIVLTLQSDYAFKYIEKYLKKYNNNSMIPTLLPPISI